ncbi:MAG: TetR family transcriptional regulator [Candidatus Dactylopiibacterium carminicum]|uniref:TetR family transcriptional regulator n=1 Tax=Candidatus Dactylopiibacterium carminicum TaxID=857335 RepID=A0A272EN85_9RHOO|nr:TetR/AcrR family transcriptional regulator [Candidatus Dactylopiibacterium carminicum]KAF7597988.1 TetR/AcrR family transcriptional regulator [Candidatus Dactylopiibacterium carminicum]PAS91561.1 MAG: TetR family transcriptional regulator [Candidatus Dactylopiibacterium carminicum]PAS93222.1 MAG: TetR family transcriptional regulator [Candidatus Dactylopiibacterium carminicum]PAS96240.1 MAG: TetR family transcriptional regulator [Candidatus Dactylopiibacterium carminicum]
MGRNKTIDRDAVLDVAESIVRQAGAAGLTIDAVARAAGISKGGVQSCFGSKDALIDAMFGRWEQSYQSYFQPIVGDDPQPVTRVRAHVEATHRSDAISNAKAAGLMAALIQSPEHLTGTRDWYRQRIAGLDIRQEADRRALLAFFATEGAFMLRFFGLMDFEPSQWEAAFVDIERLFGEM